MRTLKTLSLGLTLLLPLVFSLGCTSSQESEEGQGKGAASRPTSQPSER